MFRSSKHLIPAKFPQNLYFFLENVSFSRKKVIIFLELYVRHFLREMVNTASGSSQYICTMGKV